MSDVEHDHDVLGVVDLVQHPPAPAEPGTVDAGEFFAEGLADSLGVGEQRAGDELGGRGGDLGGQPIGDRLAATVERPGGSRACGRSGCPSISNKLALHDYQVVVKAESADEDDEIASWVAGAGDQQPATLSQAAAPPTRWQALANLDALGRGRHRATDAGDAAPVILLGQAFVLLGLGWSAGLVSASTLLAESVPDRFRPDVQGVSDLMMNLMGAGGAACPAS